jgi:hypothetical protein
VEDRPHPQVVFFGTETVLHFRKLDVGIPESFRVTFGPVGPQDVAAAGLYRPSRYIVQYWRRFPRTWPTREGGRPPAAGGAIET